MAPREDTSGRDKLGDTCFKVLGGCDFKVFPHRGFRKGEFEKKKGEEKAEGLRQKAETWSAAKAVELIHRDP
jgi:hypothetical protein